jgi:hypothetical protein
LIVDWFTQLSVPLQAAIVGAVAAVLVGFSRDFIAQWWFSKRGDRRAAKNIYRLYAEPLAAASVSLFWRLREVLDGHGRAEFLLVNKNTTAFEDYKLRSTYYRMAAMLAWIRALRRELTFFKLGAHGRLKAVETALWKFEEALADGHHVELQRLDGLASLWQFPRAADAAAWRRLSVELGRCYKRVLRTAGVTSATALSPEARHLLCKQANDLISTACRAEKVSPDVLRETEAQAIRAMEIREAWLYRDWQAAIGDLLIRPQTGAPRRFDVAGFGEFEQMMLSPSEEAFRWLERLSRFFVDVDVDDRSEFDARPATIQNACLATARLLVALHGVDRGYALVDANSLTGVRDALGLPQPRWEPIATRLRSWFGKGRGRAP